MKRLVPDEVLLGLVKFEPAHGYELLERFRSPEHLGRIWTMSTSQLYAVLQRLETEGLISGESVQVPDAPTRTLYSVTESGLQQLENWLYNTQPSTSIHRIRVMFLSRLYIARLLGLSFEAIINNQRKVCEAKYEDLLAERQLIQPGVEALTLDFVVGQLEAAIDWLDHCETVLAEPS